MTYLPLLRQFLLMSLIQMLLDHVVERTREKSGEG